jgi:hypothetical protein
MCKIEIYRGGLKVVSRDNLPAQAELFADRVTTYAERAAARPGGQGAPCGFAQRDQAAHRGIVRRAVPFVMVS